MRTRSKLLIPMPSKTAVAGSRMTIISTPLGGLGGWA